MTPTINDEDQPNQHELDSIAGTLSVMKESSGGSSHSSKKPLTGAQQLSDRPAIRVPPVEHESKLGTKHIQDQHQLNEYPTVPTISNQTTPVSSPYAPSTIEGFGPASSNSSLASEPCSIEVLSKVPINAKWPAPEPNTQLLAHTHSQTSLTTSTGGKQVAQQALHIYALMAPYAEDFLHPASALTWLSRARPARTGKITVPPEHRWPKSVHGAGGYMEAFRALGLTQRSHETKLGHWHWSEHVRTEVKWYWDPKRVCLEAMQLALTRRFREAQARAFNMGMGHLPHQSIDVHQQQQQQQSMTPSYPPPMQTMMSAQSMNAGMGGYDMMQQPQMQPMQSYYPQQPQQMYYQHPPAPMSMMHGSPNPMQHPQHPQQQQQMMMDSSGYGPAPYMTYSTVISPSHITPPMNGTSPPMSHTPSLPSASPRVDRLYSRMSQQDPQELQQQQQQQLQQQQQIQQTPVQQTQTSDGLTFAPSLPSPSQPLPQKRPLYMPYPPKDTTPPPVTLPGSIPLTDPPAAPNSVDVTDSTAASLAWFNQIMAPRSSAFSVVKLPTNPSATPSTSSPTPSPLMNEEMLKVHASQVLPPQQQPQPQMMPSVSPQQQFSNPPPQQHMYTLSHMPMNPGYWGGPYTQSYLPHPPLQHQYMQYPPQTSMHGPMTMPQTSSVVMHPTQMQQQTGGVPLVAAS